MRHVVICDDEETMCEQLCGYLQRLSDATGEPFQTTVLSSGEELLSRFPPHADILLLDIQMGAISGMEALRALRNYYPNLLVIFITSQVQYALEGYSVHAFGFLRKPVQFGQFRLQMSDALATLSKQQGQMVTLKNSSGIYRINSNDIYYIESWRHTVTVSFQNHKQQYNADLGALEQQLSGHGFCRCHKSVLVNLRHIRQVGLRDILMLNGDSVPLSRHRKAEFSAAFAREMGGMV